MTQPYVQPRTLVKGRVVIFRGNPRNPGEPIGERPAIVQRVHSETLIDLYALLINDPSGTMRGVPYSRDVAPYTWCWVDEQDTGALSV